MIFLKKYKFWLIIFSLFLLLRIIVLVTFWNASQSLGGWEHFIGHAEPAKFVLEMNWHENCDWHPPLYYTFTSLILFIFRTPWAIVFTQIILAFSSVILSYRIAGLILPERSAKILAVMVALEPAWAWYNLLFISANLLAPLLLLGLYYLFRAIKRNDRKNLYYAACFFGLGVLVRPNILMLSGIVSFILIVLFIANKKYIRMEFLNIEKKRLVSLIIIFNVIFFAIIAPWMIYNKIVYNRITLAHILSTNFYHYNLPAAISFKEKIPHEDALRRLKDKARTDLGDNVGDKGDCHKFSTEELNKHFDYFQDESKKYIFSNFITYATMHTVKIIPYFLTPGTYSMWFWYTGDYTKPDMSGSILKGDFGAIFDFLKDLNFRLFIYLFEVMFWGLCSLSAFLACIYSFRKDRDKFWFFLLTFIIIIYNAFVVSPFVEARYRMPIYVLFFAPLIYMAGTIAWSRLKNSNEK